MNEFTPVVISPNPGQEFLDKLHLATGSTVPGHTCRQIAMASTHKCFQLQSEKFFIRHKRNRIHQFKVQHHLLIVATDE